MASIILIDLSALFWATWHASADAHVSTAYEKTIERVHALRSGHDFVAVAVDHPPYWRKELLPSYKAQRDAPPEQAVEQLRRVKERLTADGLLLWSAPGFEADDVIATATLMAVLKQHTVTIASSDKDLTQLVNDRLGVRMQSLRDGSVFDADAVRDKFGVLPGLMGDLLAIAGDASDNVPGIPGIGPKTAAKLLNEYGSLMAIFENVDKVRQPKLQENLILHANAARLARRVVELRTDVPIEFADLFKPREVKPIVEVQEAEMETSENMTEDGEVVNSPQAVAEPVQMTPASQATALAVVKPVEWSMGLEPRTVNEAITMAKWVLNSRLYTRFPNAEAVFAVMVRGREMGLGALQALDQFHVIDGRPTMSANLIQSLCKKHPDCEYLQFVGGDSTYAEYETKNRSNPRPTRLKYTIEQAKQAGLVKPGSNWEKRPEEMLRKTCAVQLCRIEYPDATGGLYAVEEMGGVAA